MKKHIVKIKSIKFINYNVLQIKTDRPEGYEFKPGQATEMSINTEQWKEETRPFTFTSLPQDDYLEFTIKVYPDHNGMTEQLSRCKEGDELILRDVFGAIQYKGKGTFLAGGAGVTPFISILRSLEMQNDLVKNALIFANKAEKDIFLRDEFENLLGRNYVNVLSEENIAKYAHGHIDENFMRSTISDYSQYFYVCGPPEMTDKVVEDLKKLGATDDRIIIEDYD
ncbi:flavodoxin reductase [Zobellia amurskyensis]|uniref:Flavodoxin reductase n=1 Tax=Zobellia amurskyensis TaxID=248905 RepID=A0A7X2ZQM4_9FLAO|nr:FAD-binding oxidoreductase [Zobellia amurskyensis]MUH34597.1 flavodoxin reductase [Zobellia amurskyensis]